MAELHLPTVARLEVEHARLNVADRLLATAAAAPTQIAIACSWRRSADNGAMRTGKSGACYATTTFAELDADASSLARGLIAWGVPVGTRLALLVQPGIEFITLVFALLRAGMVAVLVDPGLGRRNLVRCLSEAEPEGFVAIGMAQLVRKLFRHRFPKAKWNVTVGRRWFWGGLTLEQLRIAECGMRIEENNPQSEIRNPKLPATHADDPAAIIFTSGSTGPPKGVLYTHRMFDTQVTEIQSTYNIEPGGIDLACFPFFALFNAAMGVTTVLPEMDFSQPAQANPQQLLAAANNWQVTQAFASPAVWRVVAEHCARTGARIPSLRQVISCGAPVSAAVIKHTLDCVAPGATMHTPYGATECLPVSTIEAAEVLGETTARTDAGAGVCVGRKFDSIDWRVIRITDEPIATIDDAEELPTGEIGELIVRGPQSSPQYITKNDEIRMTNDESSNSGSSFVIRHSSFTATNGLGKIRDGTTFWHRMGDVGYLDADGRFWYCGRKSHRVETTAGTLFTECVEAIFNTHLAVRRSALVGIGPRGRQVPVVIIERESSYCGKKWNQELLNFAQAHLHTQSVRHVLEHPGLPVDVRHNAKINRERLATWAEKQLSRRQSLRPRSPASST